VPGTGGWGVGWTPGSGGDDAIVIIIIMMETRRTIFVVVGIVKIPVADIAYWRPAEGRDDVLPDEIIASPLAIGRARVHICRCIYIYVYAYTYMCRGDTSV